MSKRSSLAPLIRERLRARLDAERREPVVYNPEGLMAAAAALPKPYAPSLWDRLFKKAKPVPALPTFDAEAIAEGLTGRPALEPLSEIAPAVAEAPAPLERAAG